ncbi:MAG TPA: hypothetical protein DCW59_11520 [Alteromonas sp.]|nr:hypothetical protein [Alteromonas sp.]
MDAEAGDYSVLSTKSWLFFFMVDTFVEYFDTLTICLIAMFLQISDSNDKYYCGPDYAAVKHNVA